jgi:hypothetical protein
MSQLWHTLALPTVTYEIVQFLLTSREGRMIRRSVLENILDYKVNNRKSVFALPVVCASPVFYTSIESVLKTGYPC